MTEKTIGVGGSNAAFELEKITNMTQNVQPIQIDEYLSRIEKATHLMKENSVEVLYLNAGTNLYYFTGTQWSPSERMVGALLFEDGTLKYIVPKFEEGTFKKYCQVAADIYCWEEHESPFMLLNELLAKKNKSSANMAIDESAAYFLVDGILKANPSCNIQTAQQITAGCRMQKSVNELAIIKQAKEITMVVQKAAAKILRPGISVDEVVHFINEAHKKAGVTSGSYFCIVLFSDDTQYPHGVAVPQTLKENDAVIVDTGCRLEGYLSDITRSYVYGTPSDEYKEIWNLEKATQLAAFKAATIGVTCGSVDDAARKTLANAGLSADYSLPGLPHRVGHGTGLDIHEYPYLVRGSEIQLLEGMVVSNEPMICIPGKFGIRHEDHFYMTENGPQWFTIPMESVGNPFGY
ncbi:M24 family metallopeptidase [Flavobacterium flavipallidum]|uniref:Xaa-Pro peptidase family protein n=1 Tax=Flavobacterium flavipallidum TaxID=3139140 RepID=A0ABU9HHQ6_9FLAO